MAASRDMVAQLVLKLRDGISAGLGGLQRRLAGLAGMAGRIGVGFGAIAGLSFLGPIQQAAAFEDVLRQNAITAGLSGQAAEAMISETARAYEKLALETGQYSSDIAAAAGQLVAANLPQELVDRFLPVLARTATATGASMTDLGSTAIALNQNLGITAPAEMAKTLAALAVAGKEGRFELRDMAQFMPTLAAGAQALGMQGREAATSLAAMLQVARRGAGTSGEAATNLANFLQKITSPDAVKNFEKMGVSLPRVIADAAKKGLNPIEVMIQKIAELTRGDQFKVGALFGDIQVLNFLKPAIANSKEYLRILELANAATEQVIDTDFETRSKGMLIRLKLIEERLTQIGRRFSVSLGGATLGPLNTALKSVQDGIEDIDKRFPGLIDGAVKFGAALAVGVAALGGLALASAAIGGGIAALGGPIGLAVIALLVGLAYLAKKIYDNWEPLKKLFAAVRQSLKDAGNAFLEWAGGWVDSIRSSVVEPFKAAWAPLGAFFDALWDGIVARFNAVIASIKAALEGITGALRSFSGAPALAGGPALNDEPAGTAGRRFGARGGAEGFYPPAAAAGRSTPTDSRVRVELGLPPGVTARTTDASPNVSVAPVNRGNTLGRP